MWMLLKSSSNPDRVGYDVAPVASHYVQVRDWAEASRKATEFIARHALGSGNWVGDAGSISKRKGDRPIAYVSYNGRVWKYGPWAPGDKPLYEPGQSSHGDMSLPRGHRAQMHQVRYKGATLWLTYHGRSTYIVDVYGHGGHIGAAQAKTPSAAIERGKKIVDTRAASRSGGR